jgi:hypothetical protein
LYGLLFSAAGLLFWRISNLATKYSVVNFCLFGELWGILTHILAIERGILDKPPMLTGSNPLAALTIAAFEFIFYWCVCLTIYGLLTTLRAEKPDHADIAGSEK